MSQEGVDYFAAAANSSALINEAVMRSRDLES